MARPTGSRNTVPKVEERHLRAAALLVQGKTQEEAAEAVGITSRGLQKWLERPDFKALVTDLRKATIELAIARIAASAPLAADEIARLAVAPGDPRVKLDAAKWIVERSAEYLAGSEKGTDPRELHNHLHLGSLSTEELLDFLARARGGNRGGGSGAGDTRSLPEPA